MSSRINGGNQGAMEHEILDPKFATEGFLSELKSLLNAIEFDWVTSSMPKGASFIFGSNSIPEAMEETYLSFEKSRHETDEGNALPPSKIKRDYQTVQDQALRLLHKLGEENIEHALRTMFRVRYPDQSVYGSMPITFLQTLRDISEFDFEMYLPESAGHTSSDFDYFGARFLALIFVATGKTEDLARLGNNPAPHPTVFTEILRLAYQRLSDLTNGPDFTGSDMRRRLSDAITGARYIIWDYQRLA